jgi:hypothetical protein
MRTLPVSQATSLPSCSCCSCPCGPMPVSPMHDTCCRATHLPCALRVVPTCLQEYLTHKATITSGLFGAVHIRCTPVTRLRKVYELYHLVISLLQTALHSALCSRLTGMYADAGCVQIHLHYQCDTTHGSFVTSGTHQAISPDSTVASLGLHVSLTYVAAAAAAGHHSQTTAAGQGSQQAAPGEVVQGARKRAPDEPMQEQPAKKAKTVRG